MACGCKYLSNKHCLHFYFYKMKNKESLVLLLLLFLFIYFKHDHELPVLLTSLHLDSIVTLSRCMLIKQMQTAVCFVLCN